MSIKDKIKPYVFFAEIVAQKLKLQFRRVLGEDVWSRTEIDCPNELVGSYYSGFVVNPAIIGRNSVVYSLGIGTDISFDLGMVNRFKCNVFCFDPTPKSIMWVKAQDLPENIHICEYGISSANGYARFFAYEDPESVQFSTSNDHKTTNNSDFIDAPIKTLKAAMMEHGHSHIDVLKVNIEGSEYEVIDHLIDEKIEVRQLAVEFHHRFIQDGVQKTKRALGRLKNAGYKIFYISANGKEFSFVLDIF